MRQLFTRSRETTDALNIGRVVVPQYGRMLGKEDVMTIRCVRSWSIVALFFLCCPAYAEVVELEGTVKAVDADAGTISIERKTAKGTKTLDLEVNKKAGDLSSLKVGDEISFSYDPDLELVTKLGGWAASPKQTGEVKVLHELDTKGHENHPWVTPDGLTIYWTTDASTPNAKQRELWMARRSSSKDLFGDKEKVGLGQDGTFTSDGHAGIIFIPQDGKSGLFAITREKETGPFGRPSAIETLPSTLGFLAGPSLSDDGCTLYFERGTNGRQDLLYSRRKTPEGAWGNPQPVQIVVSEKPRRFPHVSTSGRWLICTEPNKDDKGVLRVYHRKEPEDSFQDMGAIYVAGKPLYGRYGRYIENTSELYFTQVGEDGKFQIAVLVPFDPTTADLRKD